MREVEQIVGDQEVVGIVVQITRCTPPGGVVQVVRIRNQGGIHFVWITHPHPNPFEPFHDRERADLGGRRNKFLRGNFHTLARRVEQQPVIHTTNEITFPTSLGQRRGAVTATIIQRHHSACSIPPKHQEHLGNSPCQHSVGGDLVGPCLHPHAI